MSRLYPEDTTEHVLAACDTHCWTLLQAAVYTDSMRGLTWRVERDEDGRHRCGFCGDSADYLMRSTP